MTMCLNDACGSLPVRGARFCAALLLIGLATSPSEAQRVSAITPGTLVRVTPLAGLPVVGTLAEIRADSVFLSSTERQRDQRFPLQTVRQLAYQDGVNAHPLRGALIGAGVALAFNLLLGQGERNSEWRIFTAPEVRRSMILFGAFLGAARAPQSPNWVVAMERGDSTVRR